MEIQEVLAFIEQNKDHPELTKRFQGVTVEGVQKFVGENRDAAKWLESEKDRHLQKGLQTFKEKTLPTVLEEEISKRFPSETPEQKKIRELEQKINDAESARTRAELRNKAITHATAKGLPLDVVDFFIGGDEDATIANIAKLEATFTAAVQAAVDGKFKDGGRDVHRSKQAALTEIEKLEEQLSKATKLEEKILLRNQIYELKKE
jgi:hypothetical protein